MPFADSHFICHSIIGRPDTSIIGFGIWSVNGFRRLPKPPASITAFMARVDLLFYKTLSRVCKKPVHFLVALDA
jgi:hypothetical protein